VKLAILSPVWPSYQWLAPCLQWTLDRFWADHPPLFFCGMTQEEADRVGLPVLPWRGGENRTNWTALLRDGVEQLRALGYTHGYLIAEEHLPLAPCHTVHLNHTLPRFLESLPAVYISLMGWDNRRFPSKSPLLDRKHFRMQHLLAPRDPRFNLHPALWDLEVLSVCCDVALEDDSKNGSAWHFEKANARRPARHLPHWVAQCYQICAAEMALSPPLQGQKMRRNIERFFYLKLMALYPHIPHRRLADAYFRRMGFDNVYSDGPYPLFFSGVMAKGGYNPWFIKHLKKSPEGREILQCIDRAKKARG